MGYPTARSGRTSEPLFDCTGLVIWEHTPYSPLFRFPRLRAAGRTMAFRDLKSEDGDSDHGTARPNVGNSPLDIGLQQQARAQSCLPAHLSPTNLREGLDLGLGWFPLDHQIHPPPLSKTTSNRRALTRCPRGDRLRVPRVLSQKHSLGKPWSAAAQVEHVVYRGAATSGWVPSCRSRRITHAPGREVDPTMTADDVVAAGTASSWTTLVVSLQLQLARSSGEFQDNATVVDT
ncbi:uncharacterized protein BDZ83DRAFT_649177 [Colletotrichum acutatum]|uniref:Uncharacterized protein n=1 Tax=Glomerella acutata TaxID=27357 RepID=A0AAD8USW1_GLOAC|nr:uncharacterized protein BDZ83DRAFT_649177 [Colletotrichum acutatum]KAK1727805.1 hypothetical protein BDZ83DRAFT_649177 [Colletotrichum acutatum]